MNLKSYLIDHIEGRRSSSILEKLLLGASQLFRAALFLRNFSYDRGWLPSEKSPAVVISIGNIAAGGTGKTPLVQLLAEELQKIGSLAILSRGYLSQAEHAPRPVKVALSGSSTLYGDEPLMLKEKLPHIPIWVGKNRRESARCAVSENAEILLLDDGMQYRGLKRDFEIVVVDGKDPFGGGHFLPRGWQRDSPKRLDAADAIFITHCDGEKHLEQMKQTLAPYSSAPLIGVRFVEDPLLQDKRVAVFCGIGRRERLLQSIQKQGATLVDVLSVHDHGEIPLADLDHFARESQKKGAEWLICTEKDRIKLAKDFATSLPLHVLSGNLKIVAGHLAMKELIKNLHKVIHDRRN